MKYMGLCTYATLKKMIKWNKKDMKEGYCFEFMFL